MNAEIRRLTPDLLDDFLTFFDGEAFADNPAWASCYCMFYECPCPDAEWEHRTAAQNRADKTERIKRSEARGYLAYVDGRAVAWCNAAPRPMLPRIGTSDELTSEHDPDDIGSIVCFVVAPAHRKHGLATRLLDAACDGLRAEGLTLVEAYPGKNPTSDAGAYHGPLSMYEAAGFTRHRETEHYIIVRKQL